jgi:hypothetical protein
MDALGAAIDLLEDGSYPEVHYHLSGALLDEGYQG